MNAAGEPAFRLEAAELRHLPDDDSTVFIGPRMISLDPTQPRVVIVAERARLIQEARETHLSGNVVITRAATPSAAELRAETDYAVVLPNESVVRTDRPVRITQGQNLLTGVGMELNNKTRQLRLDSQVRAVWLGDSDGAGPPARKARPSTPTAAR
jgi:lipopolysaccharide export system protein LptC